MAGNQQLEDATHEHAASCTLTSNEHRHGGNLEQLPPRAISVLQAPMVGWKERKEEARLTT
eukprot:scaffold213643_cov31-Tisochrysis_lutea.AAC.3